MTNTTIITAEKRNRDASRPRRRRYPPPESPPRRWSRPIPSPSASGAGCQASRERRRRPELRRELFSRNQTSHEKTQGRRPVYAALERVQAQRGGEDTHQFVLVWRHHVGSVVVGPASRHGSGVADRRLRGATGGRFRCFSPTPR